MNAVSIGRPVLPLAGLPDLPRALCVGRDPRLWQSDDPVEPIARDAAKAACARCPEQAACRAWGLGHPEEVGIWGGLTRFEREDVAAQNTDPSECLDCHEIEQRRRNGEAWARLSRRLGHSDTWAYTHANRHGLLAKLKGEGSAA